MYRFQEMTIDEKIDFLYNKVNNLKFRHTKHKIQVIQMSEQKDIKKEDNPLILTPEQIREGIALFNEAIPKAKAFLDVNKDGKVDKHDVILLIKNWFKIFILIIGIEITLIWANPSLVDFSNPGFAMAQIFLAAVTGLVSIIKQDAAKKIDGTDAENKRLKEENEKLISDEKERLAKQKLLDIETTHKHNMEIINKDNEIKILNCRLVEKQTPIIVNPIKYDPPIYPPGIVYCDGVSNVKEESTTTGTTTDSKTA